MSSRNHSADAPLPPAVVRAVLTADAPQVRQVDEVPVAVGELAQIHRATWPDGREVAVKVQFPDAARRLRTGLARQRLRSRALQLILPGLPVGELWPEYQRDATAELDLLAEAEHQRAFGAAYRADPDFLIPQVHLARPRVLVTDWVAGTPVTQVVATGSRQLRDRAAALITTWRLSAPARAGLVHAGPDGAGLRILPDGRLAVLGFATVTRCPDGLPRELGHLLRAAIDGDADRLDRLLRDLDALDPGSRIAPGRLLNLAEAVVLPVLRPGFRFDRHWLHRQAGTLTAAGGLTVARALRLPPGFLPLLRMVLATVRLMCRLEARADYAGAVTTWLPGFATT